MKKHEIEAFLIKDNIVKPNEITGCSESEINRLEEHFDCKFPAAYREFLLAIGKDAGKFYAGTDIFYNELIENNNEALRLLESRNVPAHFLKNSFVFCMHHGYEFDYFDLDGNEDPPVYHYVEGAAAPVLGWDRFSTFIKSELELAVEAVRRGY